MSKPRLQVQTMKTSDLIPLITRHVIKWAKTLD